MIFLGQYLYVLFLTYVGIYVGVILSLIARDEIKIKKYYSLLRYFIYLVISFYALIMFLNNTLIIAIFILFIGVSLFMAKLSDRFLYPLLGFVYYISTKSLSVFFAQSILIFLLGFPIGTLFVIDNKKEFRKHKSFLKSFIKLNVYYASYVLVALLFYFIDPFAL